MYSQQLTSQESVSTAVRPSRLCPLFESPTKSIQGVILSPGDALNDGFYQKVIQVLKSVPNTNLSADIIAGYSSDTIREECLKHGRADFTTDWNGLNGQGGLNQYGKSLLYAYFYMRRHYFELCHLFHTHNDFLIENIFDRKKPLIIDLGCGPWTTAIAAIDSFYGFRRGVSCDCIGFERSQEMTKLGCDILGASGRSGDKFVHGTDWNNLASREDIYARVRKFNQEATIFITASYLFGSTTLDAEKLGEFVEGIINAAGERRVCFLETNTTNVTIGNKFQVFVNATPSLQSLCGGETVVNYYSSRDSVNRVYREYDEMTGEHSDSVVPPTSVRYRYMFLGNEKLALECIDSLDERKAKLV